MNADRLPDLVAALRHLRERAPSLYGPAVAAARLAVARLVLAEAEARGSAAAPAINPAARDSAKETTPARAELE